MKKKQNLKSLIDKQYKYELLENGFSNNDISIGKKVLSSKRITMASHTRKFELAFAKKLGPLEHITLGGGEPTLRNDLADIAIAFYKHTKVRNISMPTNGIRPDLLE